MMAMSKGESDGEFLKADWRLIAPLRLLGTVVSAEAKNDEERGGCGGKEGAFRDICGKPLSSASLYVLGVGVRGDAESHLPPRAPSAGGSSPPTGWVMLATVATHPQVSLGTQRILLMAAGTRRGKLGAWQPPGNSLSSKNRCWRQEEEEADHQLLQVPHRSGGRGAAAAQGHSSGNQGASLGTQQQVSGLRPPSLDEKQSGGTTECPPKPEEAPTPLVPRGIQTPRVQVKCPSHLPVEVKMILSPIEVGRAPRRFPSTLKRLMLQRRKRNADVRTPMLLERRSWRFRDSTGDHHQSKCCGSYWRR
ncbi:hypothetical protein TcYC6_0003830 [Trypanosoma cruzi]|nr:hypothetical protein TcYC6_0003830 [Trypanosoma cruzi]